MTQHTSLLRGRCHRTEDGGAFHERSRSIRRTARQPQTPSSTQVLPQPRLSSFLCCSKKRNDKTRKGDKRKLTAKRQLKPKIKKVLSTLSRPLETNDHQPLTLSSSSQPPSLAFSSAHSRRGTCAKACAACLGLRSSVRNHQKRCCRRSCKGKPSGHPLVSPCMACWRLRRHWWVLLHRCRKGHGVLLLRSRNCSKHSFPLSNA